MQGFTNGTDIYGEADLLTASRFGVLSPSQPSWRTPQLLALQHELLECALRREGIATVLDQALNFASTLLGQAGCAVVIEKGGNRVHMRGAPEFPSRLMPDLPQPDHTDPATGTTAGHRYLQKLLLDMRARSAVSDGNGTLVPTALWMHPILFDDQCTAGALILACAKPAPVETDGGRDELAAVASLVASISLAVRVAQRESSSRSADETLASLTAAIPGVVYQRVVRPDGDIRYTYISESARDLFGVSAAEILANPQVLFNRYSPDYRDGFRTKLIEASRTLTTWDVEASILTPGGPEKFTHAIARPVRQADNSVIWTGVIMDATRTKKAEAAIAAAEAQTRHAIVESLSQGLLMYDADDRLTVCNSHYRVLYPEFAEAVQLGATYHEVAKAEANHDLASMSTEQDHREQLNLRLSGHSARHYAFERYMARDRWILINEHRGPDGGTVVLYTDVTDLKLRERRIHHIAHHDALTDLPNRVLFRNKLDEALIRAKQSRQLVAVFCLDLDHFKYVNDTLGHPVGDRLLKVVADRLAGCLRSVDTAARLGGDEFAIIVPELPYREFATKLVWRLLDAIAQPVEIDGQQVMTAASVGIVLSTPGEVDSDRLIKSADLALYRAKSDGRNTFRYFEPEMDAKAQARRALEMDLRMAMARDQIDLHYQPVVDTATGDIVAFEALIRWTHPERGAVAPLDFIALAEETGLIVQLGEWILRRACNVAATWPGAVRIAVNLSPAQFRDRKLADTVLAILKETGLAPGRLELEITESLLLRDTDVNLATLHRLKGAGIRISMDDFGTGYSSLGNLRSFPFDTIKIDQSFIRDLEENPDSAAIVRSVIGLGRSLGMATIAEGVETQEQLSRLKVEGCTEIQGYYYSKPQPAAEVAKMFADVRSKQAAKVIKGGSDNGQLPLIEDE